MHDFLTVLVAVLCLRLVGVVGPGADPEDSMTYEEYKPNVKVLSQAHRRLSQSNPV